MTNQIAKNKQRLSLVLTKSQVKRLDGRAAELGTSRNELVSRAVDAYLDGVDGDPAVSARLDAITAKLDALRADQVAHTTLLADAIKSQPIAVQRQELPAHEPKKGLFGKLLG